MVFKKFLFFTLFVCLSAAVTAQIKTQRRVYLWDVTLSMFGEKCVGGFVQKDPNGLNIYKEVRNFLVQDIRSITDESTEIIVLPFQVDVLDVWREKADVSGKRDIINKIENYPKQGCSWTNIVTPMEKLQKELIFSDKNNLLILLTDGVQSETHGGKARLVEHIRRWDQFAKTNSAYCLYVMLGEGEDEDLKGEIDKKDRMIWTNKTGGDIVDLHPASELISINMENDRTASIPLKYKSSVVLPDNVKVCVTSNDNVLNIDQIVTVKDGLITFDMKYKEEYDILKTKLPETQRLFLQIELINRDELWKNAGKILFFTNNTVQIELINKPEKLLRIRLKR